MWATLRQRNFSLLWLAGLISLTGNWMLSIALPVTVYDMTGSALAVGGILLATNLPGILFSAFAGVFVDRWERRRTMVIVNLLMALALLPLLLVRSPDTLGLIYLVSLVQSTLSRFFAPAENAMLPLLSDPKLLVSANALNALNNNLARLVGPALGGLIAPLLGLPGVVVIDALTFLAAAGLVALISVRSHPGKSGEARAAKLSNLLEDWIQGLRIIWHSRIVRILFIFNCLVSISESTMYVLFVPFVTEVLHGDSVHVGGLMSSQAVGGLLGGLVIGWVALRVKTSRLLGISALCFGLVDFALFNYSHFVSGILIGYALILLAGPLTVGMSAAFDTMLQSNVADAFRGRVFGTLGMASALFGLLGIAIGGLGGDTFGIVPVINIQAYTFMIVGIASLLLLRDKVIERLATGDAGATSAMD